MAELRPHYIDVDLKKNTQYNVPVVTQNDTATHFIIRVTDDGLSDPELLDAYQEITMTSQRPDGESFYLTGTRIPGTNEIEFHLGTDETAFSGSVLASLQFYLMEDASRYTSAQFRYDVKKDLTTNYTPTQREETLVEVVLRDGPGVIQEAREAIQAADSAIVRLDEVTEENKTVFQQPVATFAALSTTYPNPEHGTTVRVTGESATYRYSDGSWVKTDEYNPTAIDQVTAQLAEKVEKAEVQGLLVSKAEKTYVDTELSKKLNTNGVIPLSQFDKNSGKFDETYLSDSLLQQMAGNTPVNATPPNAGVTTVKLVRDVVTVDKAKFIRKSSNLVNHNTISIGKAIDTTTGQLSDNASTSVSDYIPITPETTYSSYRVSRRAYYDADKNFISPTSTATGTWQTPVNAYFMRCVGTTSYFGSSLQVNLGNVLLPFEPYFHFLDKDLIEKNTVQTQHVENEAIVPINTSFFEMANNLYNKLDAIDGFVISDGAETPTENSSYSVSDFIRVKPETAYTMAKVTRLTMYDKDKKYVGRVNTGGGEFTNLDTHPLAIYVRLTVTISNKETAQFNEGSELLPYDSGVFIKDYYIKSNVDSNTYDMEQHAKTFTVYHVNEGVPDTYQEAYAMFDNLMGDSKGYISKSVLGQDALGNGINEYAFKMADIDTSGSVPPFKRLKIGILTGLHGNEKNTMVGAYEFLKVVTHNPNKNEFINRLRSLTDIHIIPVGNPSGWNADTRENHNSINLNRDFTDLSQLETQLIMDWMETDEFDYVIDYHNTSTTEQVITWVSGSPEYHSEMATHYWKAVSELSNLWSGRFNEFPENVIFGSIHDASNISATKNAAASLGIKGCTLETGWYIGYTGDGWNSITSNIISAELIGNMVLQIFNEFDFIIE